MKCCLTIHRVLCEHRCGGNCVESAILEASKLLCSAFDIPEPKVEVLPRQRCGVYNHRLQRIRVGLNAWRGIVPSFLHEFAHHLAEIRTKGAVVNDKHGLAFRHALLDVTEAWYGDHEKYAWNTEYKLVNRWYVAVVANGRR